VAWLNHGETEHAGGARQQPKTVKNWAPKKKENGRLAEDGKRVKWENREEGKEGGGKRKRGRRSKVDRETEKRQIRTGGKEKTVRTGGNQEGKKTGKRGLDAREKGQNSINVKGGVKMKIKNRRGAKANLGDEDRRGLKEIGGKKETGY